MNKINNYSKKLFLFGLLFLFLAGTAAAQGSDKMVVIKKNVSVAGGNTQTHYLAHVKSGGSWVLQDATAFSTDCIWYTGPEYNRTGTNHNYYFEDPDAPGTLHFLSAPMEANGTLSLSDSKPGTYVLSNTDLNYYFYDWDSKGIARGHQVTGIANEATCTACNSQWDNSANECWDVFWVEYNPTSSQWELSTTNSYNITAHAARAYDLTVTEHAVEIVGETTGGLKKLTPDAEMTYPSNQTPGMSVSDFHYTYVPAYTSYSFDEITTESPVATTTRTTYYQNGTVVASTPSSSTTTSSAQEYKWTLSGEGAQYLSFNNASELLTVTTYTISAPTIYYRTENTTGHKTATLTLTVTFGTGAAKVEQTLSAPILVKTSCKNPTQESLVVNYEDVAVTWYATAEKYKVEWKKTSEDWSAASNAEVTTNSYVFSGLEANTAYQYRVTAYCGGSYLTAPASATGSFTTKEATGLMVYGAVFGGGRMANVDGKTEVVIINCDSISAVYGGNDIAGAVVGADGSTITLGVNAGDSYSTSYNENAASTNVKIGSVYGGGNGYYAYNGTSFEAADDGHTSSEVAASASVKAMTRDHQVGDDVWENTSAGTTTLYFPTITKTNITVTNDVVVVDSLFGGAKNAFISNTSGDNTLVTINGGTIFSVFGGNNFGGTLGVGSNQHIELAGTKTELTDNARGPKNTYTTGFGRDFGIRYLFGGGNKVTGRNVIINVTGGQTDTVFGGGNAADVESVNLAVNCNMASGSGATWGKTYSDAIETYSGSVTVKDAYKWDGKGLYNVRTLFGGNNAANMAGLPTIALTSGSVGTVYGGGNAGDMLAQVVDDGSISGVFGSPMVDGAAQTIHYGTHVEMNSATMLADFIYGGCQKSSVSYSTWVEIKSGNVGTVYGGCNISGDVGSLPVMAYSSGMAKDRYQYVQGATYVDANGGTIHNNLFAGSNGLYHCNNAVEYVNGIDYDDAEHHYIGIEIPTHNETNVDVSGTVTVKGNVYAGGNLAPVGFINASSRNNKYRTFVGMATMRMSGGTVEGSVYGGGNMASIYGSNEVLVSGGTIRGALYGGNDRAGQVAQITNRALPAGSDIASDGQTSLNTLDVHTHVEITGRPDINTVYGGGNGAYVYTPEEYCDVTDQPIQTNTFVDINIDGFKSDPSGPEDGGHINTVYGGGNGVTVTGGITVLMNVKGSGGGAPEAYDHVDTIFGGNNMGDLAIVPDIILLKGQAKNIYGGCNQGGMTGGITVESATCSKNYTSVGSLVRLRETYTAAGSSVAQPVSGTVSGAVYGGCKMNGVTNNSLVLVEGGTHSCDIYGGSDISGDIGDTSRAVICGGSVNKAFGGGNGDYDYAVTYAGKTAPSSEYARVEVLGGQAANIYGGGNAAGVENSAIYMTGGTVTTGIYGGCNSQGNVTNDVLIDILGGTVGTSESNKADGIFGGGYGEPTTTNGNITVNIGSATTTDGATIYSDVYGGSALGSVCDATSDAITVNILSGSVTGNIYGGGLGAANLDGNGYVTSAITEAVVNGTVHVNVGTADMTGDLGPTINGSVFGCNNLAGTPKGNVYVDVYKTAHTSTPNNFYPDPVPLTTDAANFPQAAYAIQEVYGGGNLAHYRPTEASAYCHVHIHNCDNTIEYVYGGGNAAETPKNEVTIDGGRIYYAFAGGNGYGTGNPGADVVGDATLNVIGGIIDACFGASNTKGDIGGTSTVNIAQENTCYRLIKEIFGGGNEAEIIGNIVVNIPCGADGLNDVYGASNDANVTGNVTLNIWGGVMENVYGGLKGVAGSPKTITGNVTVNIYGGKMNNVFGGCNVTGNITGTIIVNVNVDTNLCPGEQQIVNVYGGGNQAAYTAPSTGYPQVNIIHGTVENDVYGGGLGATAVVTGNPMVTVGKETTVIPAANQTTVAPSPSPNTYWATVLNNVYGGGNAAQVTGNTNVLIINKSVIGNNVYGGGNAAEVTGKTNVQIGK